MSYLREIEELRLYYHAGETQISFTFRGVQYARIVRGTMVKALAYVDFVSRKPSNPGETASQSRQALKGRFFEILNWEGALSDEAASLMSALQQ